MNEQRITVAGIEATIQRKPVKNLRVTIVPPDGAVRVCAPKRMPEALIRAFLTDKADWIRTHIQTVQRQHADEPRTFQSGETVRLFGSVRKIDPPDRDPAGDALWLRRVRMP